jgi:hypothetical protein
MAKTSTPTPSVSESAKQAWYENDRNILIFTLLTAVAYFTYYLKAPGFYQQDEAGHFISMLNFWYDPSVIMGNWAKPGYKLMYVLTALGGKDLVAFQNCLFAAFSGYFAYKTAKVMQLDLPLLAMVVLVTQPLWVALSFRNYSELPSAFLLILAIWAHKSQKEWLAALCMSLLVTIRQEFYPFLGLYAVLLAFYKQWVAILLLALFPLVQNMAGYYFFNDPLYLYNQITGQSESLKDAYPRQGFDHYFKTSAIVFGPLALTLFVGYLTMKVARVQMPDLVVLVPLIGFFLLNCLFNYQAHPIGPSTGGNLRYMCVISPLVSLTGVMFLHEFKSWDKKYMVAYGLVPLLIIVAVYMSYDHNFVSLNENESNAMPAIGVAISLIALFLPLSGMVKFYVFTAIALFLLFTGVKTVKLSEEDKTCRTVAQWYKNNKTLIEGRPSFINHIMIYYYLGKTDKAIQPNPKQITQEELEKAPPGTLIFWDSHYSYRPTMKRGLALDYFNEHQADFNLLNEFRAKDNSFAIFVFEKK